MQNRELYQQILGLKAPWKVSEVKLSFEQQHVDVFVEHPLRTAGRKTTVSGQRNGTLQANHLGPARAATRFRFKHSRQTRTKFG